MQKLSFPSILSHFLLAVTLASIPFMMLASEQWTVIYGITILLVTALIFFLMPKNLDIGEVVRSAGSFFLLSIPIIASIVANLPEETHAENLIVLGCYALIGLMLFRQNRQKSMENFFSTITYSQIVAALIILLFLLSDSDNFVNLLSEGVSRQAFEFDEQMHPNFIGLMAVLASFAAIGINSFTKRSGIVIVCLALCAAASTRSGMMGVAAAYLSGEAIRRTSVANIFSMVKFILISSGIGIGVFALIYYFYYDEILQFIYDNILLLDDDMRGLGTGATGRFEIWLTALNIWLENPIFGVGYQQASDYIGDNLYAHNMILVILSDTGLVGFVSFLTFTLIVIGNCRRFWRAGERLAAAYFGIALIVYYVYGIFEGRAVNAGNPLSAVFFLTTFASCASCGDKGYGMRRRFSGQGRTVIGVPSLRDR